ncbi:Probable Co/Zn/Cd efflux system membrane fusion protein [hydrothermal vent metagenome]|uniref:Probable Co/Zn/Cd efflux system membrane fusion protein n=1 Tax=hydrothermal vent metagenome TaxID=652676 RepID=A0A1W1CZ25_9ZZZZ
MKKILIVTFLLIMNLQADDITITGTVVSDGQKMIGSRYMGYIKKVFVKVGDVVKREDVLYEMESAEFDIMKSQADLMLEQSKIVVEFWRKRLENINKRKNRLKNQKKIPMMDLDDLESQSANVESMLSSAQVMVKQASIKAKQMATIFNYLKMKAPSDGVVVRRNIKPGDMVMPGMLTIMLTDTESLEVHVSVSESIIAMVHVGEQLVVNIPSVKYKTIGTIKAIVPDANPMTHKIQMRISFDKGDKNIFPGMYAKVIIKDKK